MDMKRQINIYLIMGGYTKGKYEIIAKGALF
jgi:hypothetical protein